MPAKARFSIFGWVDHLGLRFFLIKYCVESESNFLKIKLYFLNKLIEKSQINTIFNDKIEIFKLDSNDDTFDAIVDNSSQIYIKRGFCRSLYIANDNAKLNEKQEKVIDHILDKCDRKFGGKLGVRNF